MVQDARFEDPNENQFMRGLRKISWFFADHYKKILLAVLVIAIIYFVGGPIMSAYVGSGDDQKVITVADTTAVADSSATAAEMAVVSFDTIAMKARWETERVREDSVVMASAVTDSVVGTFRFVSNDGSETSYQAVSYVHGDGRISGRLK